MVRGSSTCRASSASHWYRIQTRVTHPSLGTALIFSGNAEEALGPLKNVCRVKDWRGIVATRLQSLPIRTAREVFPQAAHPAIFIERVMGRVGVVATFTAYSPHRAAAGLSSPSTAREHRRGIRYSIAAIRRSFFAAVSAASKGCAPSSPCSRALR